MKQEVFKNRRLAYYPIELRIGKLWDSSFAQPNHGSHDAALANVVSDWKPQIRGLARRIPSIRDPVTRKRWRFELVKHDSLSHHIAILLTILPNLQSITLADVSHYNTEITEIVSLIAAANHDSTSPAYGRMLSKLREVVIECTDGDSGENPQDFGPFAEIPSMRILRGRSICDEFFDNSRHLAQIQYMSNLEEISMTECAFKSPVFKWLLRGIGSLKRFTYFYKRDESLPEDQEFCGTFSALKKYASHSLELLDVTVDVETLRAEKWDEDYWIGDLKLFKCLRSLRLDGIFFELPWSRIDSKGEESWDGETAYLEKLLPASIREVTLVKTSNLENPAVLFDDLADAKEQQFPDLKRIVVEDCFTLQKDVLEDCKKVGIEVSGVRISTDTRVPDLGTC